MNRLLLRQAAHFKLTLVVLAQLVSIVCGNRLGFHAFIISCAISKFKRSLCTHTLPKAAKPHAFDKIDLACYNSRSLNFTSLFSAETRIQPLFLGQPRKVVVYMAKSKSAIKVRVRTRIRVRASVVYRFRA